MLRSNRIEARYRALLNNYTEEMKRRRQAVIAKTDELQIADVGKKLKSQLFLILSKEGLANCSLGELETELASENFITDMRNKEIQQKIC